MASSSARKGWRPGKAPSSCRPIASTSERVGPVADKRRRMLSPPSGRPGLRRQFRPFLNSRKVSGVPPRAGLASGSRTHILATNLFRSPWTPGLGRLGDIDAPWPSFLNDWATPCPRGTASSASWARAVWRASFSPTISSTTVMSRSRSCGPTWPRRSAPPGSCTRSRSPLGCTTRTSFRSTTPTRRTAWCTTSCRTSRASRFASASTASASSPSPTPCRWRARWPTR